MKMRIALLSLLTILCLALCSTAFAGVIYDDGPIDGNTNGLFIDGPGGAFGQTISDGYMATGSGTPGVLTFGEWTAVGSTPTAINWAFGSTSFGTDLGHGSGVIDLSTSHDLGPNPFGFEIWETEVNLSGGTGLLPQTMGGTYYLTLNGATDSLGGSDAWDINNGAATCFFENPAGSGPCGFPGESFTISTSATTTTSTTSTTTTSGTTPEPSSIMLLGSGILGLAGVLRRKLTR